MTGRGYARYYGITVEQETEVTIDLESSEDTYLYLRRGEARSGTALHENDDVASGNTDSQIVATLSAGSYTIEATTYNAGTAGSFTLTVSGLGGGATTTTPTGPTETAGCFQSVGALTAKITRSGEWTRECASTHRAGRYARFYSFTLEESKEAEISLESSEDTYLYLLRGSDSDGSEVDDNDDVESGNTDSGLTLTLAAGSYTIEATTYNAGTAGSFTLTISPAGSDTVPVPDSVCRESLPADSFASRWAAGCESEVRSGSYARYYTFTLGQGSEVTITLTSETEGVDPYLYLRTGTAQSGVQLYDNDDHDGSTRVSQIQETLAVGTYTVEVTTYNSGETGNFFMAVSGVDGGTTPTTPTESAGCFQSVGALTAEITRSGEWSGDCASTHQSGSYARFYSFTLDEETEVTISLESSEDTFLYLLRGADSGGSEVDDNDDVESGNTDSGLTLTLAAGTYTIEATTFNAGATGSFTLTINPAGSDTAPENRAPTITGKTPASPVSVATGSSQSFSVTGLDADNNINAWEWFLDDVSQGGQSLALTGSSPQSFSHTFGSAGSFTVKVTFTDTEGESVSDTWTVQVSDTAPENRAPTITGKTPASPVSVATGSSQSFSATGLDADKQHQRVGMVPGRRVPGRAVAGADRVVSPEFQSHLRQCGKLHSEGDLHGHGRGVCVGHLDRAG